MSRCCVFWILVLAGLGVWVNSGCIAGVHHHRVSGAVDHHQGQIADVSGTVDSVDLGLVADFRVLRLGMPFEGQRRKLEVNNREGGRFTIDQEVENRTLRLDVPLLAITEFGSDPTGKRYPGRMARRHTLEVWTSGSVGVAPISPVTATAGVAYYRYGGIAVRLFGGYSRTPYSGRERVNIDGRSTHQPREGSAPGAVVGLEVTLAAGEYALELARFILDLDREARDSGLGR